MTTEQTILVAIVLVLGLVLLTAMFSYDAGRDRGWLEGYEAGKQDGLKGKDGTA